MSRAFKLTVEIIIALAMLFFAVTGSYYIYKTYLWENTEIVPVFSVETTSLVIEGDKIEGYPQPFVEGTEYLLPFDVVKKYIDPYIYYDENLKKVSITTEDKVIRMNEDSLDAYVNEEPVELKVAVVNIDGCIYVPIAFLKEFYSIEIEHNQENNVIIIDFKQRNIQTALPCEDNIPVKNGMFKREPVVKYVLKGEELRVFGTYENWYRVRTKDGILGYVEKKNVVVEWKTVFDVPYEKEERKTVIDKKINLTWHYIYMNTPDMTGQKKTEGLDVLSPTWFRIADKDGTITSKANKSYSDWAHSEGYLVWALFKNEFAQIDVTSEFLNNTDARENAIKQILVLAELYDIDGINFDFENIYLKDREALTQFVREAVVFFHLQGLTVSIDVGIPGGSETYSLCYDHKALSEAVDYMMVMTYDQHWGGCPVAGSVSSIDWVERNLKKTLELVSEEKLLLGLPFYTRLWQETKDKDGNVTVASKVMTMDQGLKAAVESGGEIIWKEENGQFYCEFMSDGILNKIWLENTDSINMRTSLVLKYNLAGTASWNWNFETEGVWEVINENTKKTDTYMEWKVKNGDMLYAFMYNGINNEETND